MKYTKRHVSDEEYQIIEDRVIAERELERLEAEKNKIHKKI